MPQFSSSTSSSSGRAFDTLKVIAGFAAGLLAADILLGLLFQVSGADAVGAGRLARYFDYGRSTEGKIRRLVEHSIGLPPDSVLRVGWYEEVEGNQPRVPEHEGGLLIAAYGQSFTNRAMRRVAESMPTATFRLLGGPSSTLTHSYYLNARDRGQHEASVVVLGILGSSFTKMETMGHMTWNFESPFVYTYPRYQLVDGELQSIEPSLRTAEEAVLSFSDSAGWDAFVSQLREHDVYYDPHVFSSILDASTIVRLARRGYGQQQTLDLARSLQGSDGYHPRLVALSFALLEKFVAGARADDAQPIVLLLHDRGSQDHLERALGPWLRAHDVDYVSTHAIAPSSDPEYYLSDGHFVPEIDVWIGNAIVDHIQARH
jgi:hypothetical protein